MGQYATTTRECLSQMGRSIRMATPLFHIPAELTQGTDIVWVRPDDNSKGLWVCITIIIELPYLNTCDKITSNEACKPLL